MNSIIYQVQHPQYKYSSYLIGSVHIADQRLQPYLEKFKIYIDKTEVTAFEIDFNDVQPNMEDFILPDDNRVSSYVTIKRWKKMRHFANKKFGMDLNEMDRFFPMIILNMFQELLVQKQHLLQMDIELYSYAQSLDKKIRGLEETDFHYGIIHHIDMKIQVKMLKEFLGNISKQNKYFDKLLELYLNQDLNKLYKSASKGLHGLRGVMLYSRNRVIASNFRRIHQQTSVTAVLGVAHLPGEKGILRLLKEYGYHITPINLNIN